MCRSILPAPLPTSSDSSGTLNQRMHVDAVSLPRYCASDPVVRKNQKSERLALGRAR